MQLSDYKLGGKSVFVIAEIGNNHNGSVKLALEMVNHFLLEMKNNLALEMVYHLVLEMDLPLLVLLEHCLGVMMVPMLVQN